MKRSALSLMAILLAASMSIASAQPMRAPRPGNRMEAQHARLMEDLKLTDQQKEQLQKFHLDLQRKQTQIHSKIQLARLDMKETFLSDKIDRSAIEKNMKQVSDLQQQLKMNLVDFWFSVNNILTPDQQKVWKKHAEMMVGAMHRRMRGGMPGRMQGRMHGMGPSVPQEPKQN